MSYYRTPHEMTYKQSKNLQTKEEKNYRDGWRWIGRVAYPFETDDMQRLIRDFQTHNILFQIKFIKEKLSLTIEADWESRDGCCITAEYQSTPKNIVHWLKMYVEFSSHIDKPHSIRQVENFSIDPKFRDTDHIADLIHPIKWISIAFPERMDYKESAKKFRNTAEKYYKEASNTFAMLPLLNELCEEQHRFTCPSDQYDFGLCEEEESCGGFRAAIPFLWDKNE